MELRKITTKKLNLKKEKGAVLFFALIIVVIMIIACLALIRSNDSANNMINNLMLKQSATYAADTGMESAINWLNSIDSTTLQNNSTANGYYATSQTGLNLITGVDWDGTGTQTIKAKVLPTDSNGNKTSYVINRLCTQIGDPATAGCATYIQSTGNSTSSKGGNGVQALTGVLNIYYRVTVRVVGPKNTVSYIQSIMYM